MLFALNPAPDIQRKVREGSDENGCKTGEFQLQTVEI